jgi:predicted methyltransferase
VSAALLLLALLLQQATDTRTDFVQHEALREEWALRDVWQEPRRVVDALALRPGQVVADLGAGKGYFSHHLAAAVAPDGRVLVLDINDEALQINREMAALLGAEHVEPRLVPPDDPDLAAAEVDVVFLCNAWNFLPDRIAYATKLRRGLRKDGRLAVIGWGRDRAAQPMHTSRRRSDRYSVQRETEAAGFRLEATHEFLARQFFLLFRPGSASIFERLRNFHYVTADLAIGSEAPDSSAVVALRQRGFKKIVDLRRSQEARPTEVRYGMRCVRLLPEAEGALETLCAQLSDPEDGIVYVFAESAWEVAETILSGIRSGMLKTTESEELRLRQLPE